MAILRLFRRFRFVYICFSSNVFFESVSQGIQWSQSRLCGILSGCLIILGKYKLFV